MSFSINNLAEILRRTARDQAAAVALRCRGTATTYGELDRLANRLAHALRWSGVEPGDRVGLVGFKSPDLVAAMQAVLRADAVYVPLDPRAPASRLALICADCGVRAVIHDDASARHAGALAQAGVSSFLSLGESVPPAGCRVRSRRDVEGYPATPLGLRRGATDLAYILYTSGSTGRPKGVMISHENALTFIRWAAEHFAPGADDRLLNHAPLTFDLPVFDLYNGFLAGATVVLLPEADALFPASVVRTIREERVTSLYLVPSACVALMSRGGLLDLDPSPLRRIMYSGEAFPVPSLRRLREWAAGVPVCNLYGPIETNACTFHEVGDLPEDGRAVSIGKPITGVEIVLLGSDGREVGPTETGEICVLGGCVTPGYWGNPEYSRSRQIAYAGRTWFRTGDLASRDTAGDLWFHGREDHLVKSRGFRIELGEVEHALSSHPGVVEAAVVAVPDEELGNVLYGWFVPADRQVKADQVKAHIAGRLPSYMVPREVFAASSLPKTGSGKTSRKELAALLASRAGGKEVHA